MILSYGEITVTNLDEPFHVQLTNEAQQFGVDLNNYPLSNYTFTTDVIVFQGSSSITDFSIGTVSSANGITVSKNNKTITCSVSKTTRITADNGSIVIPVIVDGKTVNRTLSWSVSRVGATGTAAKLVNITPSSQFFKSTDGGVTFAPNTITLTPDFQGDISFASWQYSTNGTNWTTVTSGSHGLTVSNNVLTINKTCDLYTSSVTAISFKCVTNDDHCYDIVTVAKIYDVTELEIGGVNVFVQKTVQKGYWLSDANVLNSNGEWGVSDYINVSGWKHYVASGFTNLGIAPATCFYDADKNFISGVRSVNSDSQDSKRRTLPIPSNAKYMKFSVCLVDLKTLKIEKGLYPTSYSPSPEDIEHEFVTMSSTISGVKSTADNNALSITNKVWQTDIDTTIDTFDKSTVEAVRTRVSATETSLKGITSEVSDIKTSVAKKADGSTVTALESKVATAEQNLSGFKQEVSETYMTQSEGQTISSKVSTLEQTTGSISASVTNVTNRATNLENKVTNTMPTGLRWKVNYSAFSTSNQGELYLHGINATTGEDADTDGWVYFNGKKITVPKGMINPNTMCPYNIPIYVVRRPTTSSTNLVWYSSGWKSGKIDASSSATVSSWSWTDDDAIFGSFVMTGGESAVVNATLYNPVLSHRDVNISEVSKAEFKILSDSIETRVEKNGVVSAINQSAENIKIQAEKVDLEGSVTFSMLAPETMREISDNVDLSGVDVSQLDISVGAKNLIFNSKTLIHSNYSFGAPDSTGGHTQIPLEDISLNSTASLSGGRTYQTTVTYVPVNTTQKSVSWSSSNPEVATVSNTGLITWRSPGTTVITCTSTVNPSIKDSFNLTCGHIGITAISIPSSLTIEANSAKPLIVTYTPSDTTQKGVIWTSDNPSIATVDNGIVRWMATGSATITATSSSNSNATSQCTVTCTAPVVGNTDALTALSIPSTATCPKDETIQLAVSYTPATTSQTEVSWTSSDTSKATVSNTGLVTWKHSGEVIITVSSKPNPDIKATCTVTCAESNIPITGLSIPRTATCAAKSSVTLTPTFTPSNTTQKNINWISNNQAVATVNASGVVTWKNAGTVTITATSTYNNSYSSSCTVTCSHIAITGISLPASATCNPRGTLSLTPILTPSDTTQTGVNWTSSNTSVATVDTSGVVTWKSKGTANITCTSKSNSNVKAVCVVTCPEITIAIRDFSIPSSITCAGGQSVTIPVSYDPVDTTQTGLTWSSSNTSVATVSTSGVVTWKGVGQTTLTVTSTADSNLKKYCSVTCEHIYIQSITLPETAICPLEGTVTLTPVIAPTNTTQPGVTWSTSDATKATVNNGVVTWKSEGTVIITCRSSANSSVYSSCTVTCRSATVPVETITLSASAATVEANSTFKLNATLSPSDTTQTELRWNSNNQSVATIDSTGLVTWKAEGSATITCTSVANPSVSASCSITCNPLIIALQQLVIPSSISLEANSSVDLTLTYVPVNTTQRDVTWESSDTTKATVSTTGRVTWKAAGTTTITVTSRNNPDISASCTVNCVTQVIPLTALSIPSSLNIAANASSQLNVTYTPTDTTELGVAWDSSAPQIASVSPSGLVAWMSAGEADITVTSTANTAISATCHVVCAENIIPITGLAFQDSANITLEKGESSTLPFNHLPSDTTQTQVSWTSNKTSVASVDSYGTVTAVSPGTATITVTSVANNSVKATKTVTVKSSCTGISVSPTSLTFTSEDPQTLTATVTPSDTTDTISWASNNTNVVNVSNGVVTPVANGEADIVVTCGRYSATCTVVVDIQTSDYIFLESALIIAGNSSVDTGIVIGTDLSSEFEIGFAVPGAGYGYPLATTNETYIVRYENTNLVVKYGWMRETIGTLTYGTKLVVALKNQSYIYGDKSAYCYPQTIATQPLYLAYHAQIAFYHLKVWNSGALVLDWVPAKASDGTLGLYDNLTATFTPCSMMTEQ